MKWDKPNGAVQHTSDKHYCVMQATEENWVAYELVQNGTSHDLGVATTDQRARALCEAHHNRLAPGQT